MLSGGAALVTAVLLADYSLVAGGDASLARDAHLAEGAQAGERWLEPIGAILRGADLAMVNLECVVSTRGRFQRKPESRPYFYRARPDMLEALTSVGIDFVAAANNHSMDYGPTAVVEQLELLEAAGIAQAGAGANLAAALRPTYVRVGEVVVAFLGVDASLPEQTHFGAKTGRAGVAHADTGGNELVELLEPQIREARQHAHLVIVTPHWGANWTDGPDRDLVRIAHALIDAGADLILGHSSHQFHGVERYHDKLIVYDMGTVLFDRTGQGRMRKGLLFRLIFNAGGVRRLEVLPLNVSNNSTRPAQGSSATDIVELFRSLTHDLDPDLSIENGRDGWLAVPLDAVGPARSITAPPSAHPAGRTRPLPEELAGRRPDTIVPELPRPLRGGRPIDLGGIEYLGARLPDKIPERHDAIVELYLRGVRPPSSRRLVVLTGEERSSGCRFNEAAEPGDWSVPTSRWRRGDIVHHRVALRGIGQCGPGRFELYAQLSHSRRAPRSGRKAWIGSLEVFSSIKRRQRLVEPSVAFPAGSDRPVQAERALLADRRILVGGGAAVVLAIGGFGFLRHKRRRRKAPTTRSAPPPTPEK